jgi:DNA-binding transcriptional MocR family regulator
VAGIRALAPDVRQHQPVQPVRTYADGLHIPHVPSLISTPARGVLNSCGRNRRESHGVSRKNHHETVRKTSQQSRGTGAGMTTRYERYANEIAELICRGALRPDDRLPSVRKASATQGLSRSTVFAAYYLLEARGLIRVRPRSGYFVNARPVSATTAAPKARQASEPSGRGEIDDVVIGLLRSAGSPELVQLGSGFLCPSLYPLARLARHLWTGMRDLDPTRVAQDLVSGNEDLRRQIQLRYGLNSTAVDADEIILTNGAMEGLNLCLQAVTRPGEMVAIESPTFYPVLQALERLNLQALTIPTHPRYGVDVEALAIALRRHRVAACWFMPNFQNPLGSLMPQDCREALVALLVQHGIPLIEHDVCAELYFGGRKPLPAKHYDREGLVMHCGSFSKCLAPGYRVGWVAGGRFARQIEHLRIMHTLSPATPSVAAIASYLAEDGYDRHLRRMRATLAGYKAAALDAIRGSFPRSTRVAIPEGGYFLWLQLPRKVNALALHRLALAHNITLAPGPMFSLDRRFTHCVRINYSHGGDRRFLAAVRKVGELAVRLAAS